MLVPEVLLQTADDIARFVKAVRRVQVGTLALCKFADQNGLLLITCVRVDVFLLLRVSSSGASCPQTSTRA